MSRNKTKRFLEISFALILVIALSSHALIYEALAIQWQKIFQEARQWQIASDSIEVDAISSGNINNAASLDLTHVVAANASIIVVSVGNLDATLGDRTVSTVVLDPDGTPEGFIHIAVDNDDETDLRTEIWYLIDPDASGSSTIRITTGGTCSDLTASAVSFTGSDLSSPIDVTQTGSGGSTPPSISISTNNANSFVVDSLASNEPKASNITEAHTKIHITDIGSDTIGSQYVNAGDAGAQTMNYGDKDSDTTWIMSAVEIKEGEFVNTSPTIKAVSLQGTGVTTINLVEGAAVDIMVSASIEDAQGCTDVRDGGGVKAIVYLYNAYNASCSQDNNNCYDEDIASCSWQSTAGDICSYECTASAAMYYYADPTLSVGGTASKADEEWAVTIIASDSYWEDVTSNSWDPGASGSTSAEVALLLALDVSAGSSNSINYGSLDPDQDSDETGGVLERGVKNTGNRPMNLLIQQATVLTKGSDTILADKQQFANFTFTVGNGTSLSVSNQTLDLELPQQTDDTGASTSDDQLFWGIYVPSGQAPGNYTGTTTYTADAD